MTYKFLALAVITSGLLYVSNVYGQGTAVDYSVKDVDQSSAKFNQTIKDRIDISKKILVAIGRSNGIMVVTGVEGTDLAIDLVKQGRFKSRVLCATDRELELAQTKIQKANMYGEQLAAIKWDASHIPFGDRVIDLLIVPKEKSSLTLNEIARVLGSHSVVYFQQSEKIRSEITTDKRFKTSKQNGALIAFRQILKGLDNWTHVRHGADNNPKSEDKLAGPPYTSQWIAGPAKARGHGAGQALVANGRLFYTDYVIPTPENHRAGWSPARYQGQKIHAFDADNGFILWEKTLQLSPKFRGGSARNPLFLVGDEWVFVIGTELGCQIINAATGKIERSIGTGKWQWASFKDGKLIGIENGKLGVYDPKTGKPNWKVPLTGKLSSLSPTVLGKRVLLQFNGKGGRAQAYNIDSGKLEWDKQYPELERSFNTAAGWENLYVLSTYDSLRRKGYSIALNATDGSIVWKQDRILGGNGFILGNPIVSALMYTQKPATPAIQYSDPKTGKLISQIANRPRIRCVSITCLRDWAFTSGGLTMLHATTKEQYYYSDFRTSCGAGAIHGNGCTYLLPNDCLCFHTVAGLIALSSRNESTIARVASDFETGNGKVGAQASSDWPTYKYDIGCSSSTPKTLEAPTKISWKANVGGKPTSPIVAEGLVITANDQHQIKAYNSEDGKLAWRYTAGGAITQTPTYAMGAIFFGALDGWVYALEAKTGTLAWRRKLLAADYILVSNYLSSRTPVKTNVLVDNGIAWACAGGISPDGVLLIGLDAKTGKVLVSNNKLGLEPDELKQTGGDTGKKQVAPMGISPEGAMIATKTHLILPNGFGRPIVFNRDKTLGNGTATRGLGQGNRMTIAGHYLFQGLPTVGDSAHTSWGRGGGYFVGNMKKKFTNINKGEPKGIKIEEHTYTGFHADVFHRVGFAFGGPLVTQGLNVIGSTWQREGGSKISGVEIDPSSTRSFRYDVKWSTPIPILTRSALRAGDTYYTIGEGVKKDGRPNGKTMLFVLGAKDGTVIHSLPLLDGHPCTDGIATGQGKLFFVTEEGLLIALGS